jgi:hypothetical protein
MSGVIGSSTINYASLFPGAGSATNNATSILQALYGGTVTATTGTSSLDPIDALKLAQANRTTAIATEAKTPTVELQIAAFTKAVQSATSVQSLLSNRDFLQVFLTANGLGAAVDETALAQQALTSNPASSTSLASQLSGTNAAWLSTAKTYNFYANGLAAIQNPKVLSTITSGYAEVLWRQSLDQQTPGLSNALYFLANASTLTSPDLVLGNSVARTVVTTAFGIPEQIAYQPLQAQEAVISNALDFSKLSNSQYVQTITDQYLVQLQASASSSSSSSSIASLIA